MEVQIHTRTRALAHTHETANTDAPPPPPSPPPPPHPPTHPSITPTATWRGSLNNDVVAACDRLRFFRSSGMVSSQRGDL